MKKILRLFIPVLCVLLALGTMPETVTALSGSLLGTSGDFFRDSFRDSFIGSVGNSFRNSFGSALETAFGSSFGDPSEQAGEAVPPGTLLSVSLEKAGSGVNGIAQTALASARDTAAKEKEQAENAEKKKDGTDRKKKKDAISYYYYTRISKEERLLYDAMLGLAEGASLEESRIVGVDPSSEEFAEIYTRAYNALVSDHPELFWIAQARVSFECRYYVVPSFGGKYKVVLSLSGSKDDFAVEQKRLEESADALLRQTDLTGSDAEIALRLHDLLIENAWYNEDAGTDDYAHTAYGALVENSSGIPGGALCDGYSLAYEYLLQRAGVTCTVVCGYAGSSQDNLQKHAWNLVRLGDDWYEVDPTWDDLDLEISPSSEGYDLFLEAMSDRDYLDRLRHYMFNRTTEQMRSFTPGDEYTYTSSSGWVSLLQPSVHIRFTPEDSEVTRDYVTPLAPEAEGTLYTWEILTGNES